MNDQWTIGFQLFVFALFGIFAVLSQEKGHDYLKIFVVNKPPSQFPIMNLVSFDLNDTL